MRVYKKLSTDIFKMVFLTLFTTVAILIIFWIYNMNSSIQMRMDEFKKEYIKSQKQFIKTEIDSVLTHIEYDIKKFKNHTQLKKDVLDRLKYIRFGKDGYIFVDNLQGICIMHPVMPEIVGKNLINIQDANGKYVKRELIKAALNPNNHFVEYVWNRPSSGKPEKKIAYVRVIKEWGWFIGTGIYK